MNDNQVRLSFRDWISLALGTWFGSGLLPKMPGTWGTLAAIPFIAALSILLSPLGYLLGVAATVFISIPIAARAARLYRSHPSLARFNPHAVRIFDNETMQKFIKGPERQKEDPGMIVIDEVAGYAAAMILLPPSITAFALSFVFFRAFDIFKLQPGRLVEKLPHGIGIVLDDVVAGIYACILSHAFLRLAELVNIGWLP
jgi:phosphatidylglycerophosphatase A